MFHGAAQLLGAGGANKGTTAGSKSGSKASLPGVDSTFASSGEVDVSALLTSDSSVQESSSAGVGGVKKQGTQQTTGMVRDKASGSVMPRCVRGGVCDAFAGVFALL